MARKGKGDCFDTAARLVTLGEYKDHPNAVLVHGIVWNGALSIPMWHAWVEITETFDVPVNGTDETRPITLVTCIDKANGNDAALPRAFYYNVGHVAATWAYTATEAGRLIVANGHWGPWEDDEPDDYAEMYDNMPDDLEVEDTEAGTLPS